MTLPESFTVELPSLDSSDGELLAWMGVDAVRWARVFERNMNDLRLPLEGMLIGWFANAIGAGEIAAQSAARAEIEKLGEIVDRQSRELIELTNSQDVIADDGDGDWEVVWDRLHEMKAENADLRRQLEDARKQTARVAATGVTLSGENIELIRHLESARDLVARSGYFLTPADDHSAYCAPCQAGLHIGHRAELAGCCVGCACEVVE